MILGFTILGLTLEQFILVSTALIGVLGSVIWFRTKMAEIETKLCDMYVRINKNENDITSLNNKLDEKITRFDDKNDADHKIISDKVDVIKDMLTDIKVEISKNNYKK